MRPLPLVALFVLASLAASSVHASEWPQFHYDSLHTGAVSTESPFAPPRERWWSQSTAGPIEGSPVVSDGRVFIGSTDGKMYAFDAISGSPLWVFDAKGPITSTPALSGGILYVVTNSGSLFAIDAVTGKLRLSAGQASPDPGPSRTSPSIHEGRLYLGTEGGSVIAYNLFTLTKDWEYKIGDEKLATNVRYDAGGNATGATCEARFATKPVRSSPAVVDNKVFFGSDDHVLFAVDEFGQGGQNAGKTIGVWGPDPVDLTCPPSFPVADMPSAQYFPMLGDVLRAAPAVDEVNNIVIVASYDNTVRAYDIDTGEQKWNYTVLGGGSDHRVISTPAVYNGMVYFGSFNGRFYALRTTPGAGVAAGVEEVWTFAAGGANCGSACAIWSSAAVAVPPEAGAHPLVAFGADDETAYVLDGLNGQELWRSRIGGDVRSSPAIWTGGVVGAPIQGGVLYVGGADGILYAYGGQKPPLPDLLIANITYPSKPLPLNADVEVNITVKNAGNSSSPSTNLTLFIDGALASTQPVLPLAAGETTRLTYVWRVTQSNHTIVAKVDPAGLSREFDRANNEMRVDTPKASAPPPPPAPTNATAPPPQPAKKKAPGLEPILALAGVAAVALSVRRRRN
jgi:outer membrane protein assembly factor BamB